MLRNVKTAVVFAVILLWLGAVAVAFEAFHRYKTTPGATRPTLQLWPSASHLEHPAGRPTLLMFAHPQCPCTQASMEEFAHVISSAKERPSAYVVFVQPKDTVTEPDSGEAATISSLSSADRRTKNPEPERETDIWKDSKLWTAARAIPGVTALLDRGGGEARLFGATTSGHVFLYDRAGQLQFSGGITDERGHAGENPAEDSVVALLSNERPLVTHAPVFGCSLDTE